MCRLIADSKQKQNTIQKNLEKDTIIKNITQKYELKYQTSFRSYDVFCDIKR